VAGVEISATIEICFEISTPPAFQDPPVDVTIIITLSMGMSDSDGEDW